MHELHAFVHTDCYCACVYTYRLLLHTVAHPKCDWPLETHINRRAHCAHSLNLERSTSKHQAPPLSPCCNHHRCPSTPNCHSCVLQLLCRTRSAASPSSMLPYVGAVTSLSFAACMGRTTALRRRSPAPHTTRFRRGPHITRFRCSPHITQFRRGPHITPLHTALTAYRPQQEVSRISSHR